MSQPFGHTNEQPRHDWVRERLAELDAGARLLDAGAGTQRYRPDCQHLEYTAQDFCGYDGQGDGTGNQTGSRWSYDGIDLRCDIADIPQPDASYDALLCTEVFEHIPHPLDALREFARLLKPHGTLLLTTPFTSATHYAPYYFYSGFSRYFFEKHLPEAGFRITQIQPNGGYFHFLEQELQRAPSVATKYADRPPSWFQRQTLKLAERVCRRLAQRDRGSSEFLTFGLHIQATRLTTPVTQAAA
ncbi:MAG: class I SAM-dependent methyltransferase [Planctomycetota bacterium]